MKGRCQRSYLQNPNLMFDYLYDVYAGVFYGVIIRALDNDVIKSNNILVKLFEKIWTETSQLPINNEKKLFFSILSLLHPIINSEFEQVITLEQLMPIRRNIDATYSTSNVSDFYEERLFILSNIKVETA